MKTSERSMVESAGVEDALRRQLDFTRAITNNLGEGVYAVDREGRVTFMNPAAERILGWTEAELLGKNMHEAIHFQRADKTVVPVEECPMLGVIQTGSMINDGDDVFTRKDGTIFPIAYTSAPIVTNGQIEGAVLAFRDTTARHKTEAELEASEQRYHYLADAMPQLVWATDENGSHTYYNRRWFEFTGLSEEESMGFGFANALHPDDKERTLARWQRAWRDGEAYDIEYRFYSRPQKIYRWFLGRATPVRDDAGKITQWVGTCTDIEEQKHMEVTLARINQERTQLLQEVSTPIVPIWRGILALPIVGSLDTARMQQATETALNAVMRTGARACIIDITGARIVDSHAVANLSSLVSSLKLIGAEAIVTGVTAHVAQSLVGLGLDFTGMRTHRTLAEALSHLIKTTPEYNYHNRN